ncbi:MAG: tRNA (guanosine(46)-N7)-methyltransferase TrmB [Steroidobacteraceae bacterium]|jgi:tRNA (guanine-N7-)-methyltransferase|nr:tRNA (guanosine(46)-N7)-methyltransferase TrmB [Steroidobacteraceae bacterium]
MQPIRSFVRRGGRVTGAQERALAEVWPRFGVEYAPEILDLDGLFGRRAPRILEIGFGNGDTLVELAARRPEADFIGVEVHPPGVGRCLLGIESQSLTNVRVISHDAVEVLGRMIPDASLDEVLLYFPDPWPKKRHHKRRIVQPEFAELVARKIAPGGAWRLATDWAPYAAHMLEVLTAAPGFVNAASGGGFVPRPDSRPETKFERRGQRLGHEVFDLEFRRR